MRIRWRDFYRAVAGCGWQFVIGPQGVVIAREVVTLSKLDKIEREQGVQAREQYEATILKGVQIGGRAEQDEGEGTIIELDCGSVQETLALLNTLSRLNREHAFSPRRYTLAELQAMPTLAEGQFCDVKLHIKAETPDLHVLLYRTTIGDGEPYNHKVVVEYKLDGRWIVIDQYQAL